MRGQSVLEKFAQVDTAFLEQLGLVENLLFVAYLVQRDVLVTVGWDPGLLGSIGQDNDEHLDELDRCSTDTVL